jgi:hypothetical protein
MSSDLIDHNDPSLDVREFLSLGGGSGLDGKSLSPDGIFSHDDKILARLFCDLLGSFGRSCRSSAIYYTRLTCGALPTIERNHLVVSKQILQSAILQPGA